MHRIKHHIKKHHKKYLFSLFGGWAIFKTMLLILGLFGISEINLNQTYATDYPISIFTPNTPPHMTITGNRFINVSIDVIGDNMSGFLWNRNSKEYLIPIYSGVDEYSITKYDDNDLVFAVNLDNIDSLGESAGITGGTIKDLVSNRIGTGNGNLYWTGNGKFGGSYVFDGIGSYIDFGSNLTGLTVNSGYTYTVWLKTNKVGFQWILNNGDSEKGTNLILGNGNVVAFYPRGGSIYITGDLFISTGNWHLLAVTRNSSPSQITFYLDGQFAGSRSVDSFDESASGKLFLGSYYTAAGQIQNFFDGQIDEVRIYNRPLGQNEIYEIYNSNITKYDTNKRLFTTSITGLDYGIYDYYGIAINKLNNTGSTETRKFMVFDEVLNLTFTGPNDNRQYIDIAKNHTISAYGGIEDQSSNSCYETIYFDGIDDYIELADSDDRNFGSGDFTMELWFNASGGFWPTFFSQSVNGGVTNTNFWFGKAGNVDKVSVYIGNSNGIGYAYNHHIIQSSFDNKRRHVAWIRQSNNSKIYLDGILSSVQVLPADYVFYNSSLPFRIGTQEMSSLTTFKGYMSQIKITKGYAKYTGDFNPGLAPCHSSLKSYIVGYEEESDWLDVSLSKYRFTNLRKTLGLTLNEAYNTIFNIKNNLGRATSGDRLMTPFGFRAPVPDLISSGENVTVELKVKFFNLNGE